MQELHLQHADVAVRRGFDVLDMSSKAERSLLRGSSYCSQADSENRFNRDQVMGLATRETNDTSYGITLRETCGQGIGHQTAPILLTLRKKILVGIYQGWPE